VAAYAYLLKLRPTPALSSDTFGLYADGAHTLNADYKLLYRAEWAWQRANSHTSGPDYAAHYWHLRLGLARAARQAGIGWESLGADNGRALQTPLATLHAFNGWTDTFLSTPAEGHIRAWPRSIASTAGEKPQSWVHPIFTLSPCRHGTTRHTRSTAACKKKKGCALFHIYFPGIGACCSQALEAWIAVHGSRTPGDRLYCYPSCGTRHERGGAYQQRRNSAGFRRHRAGVGRGTLWHSSGPAHHRQMHRARLLDRCGRGCLPPGNERIS
jgi:hypothetical protein